MRENYGPNYSYWCIVDRVVDGDTVDVRIDLGFNVWIKDRVRLLGIDTPESRTRDLREKTRGLEAKAKVQELLPLGERALIQTSRDGKGKFGRVLGNFVLPDGRTVAEVLIAERMAVRYHGQSKDDIAAEHLANYAYREALTGGDGQ